MGNSPTVVVMDVRIMGLSLTFPASITASTTFLPSTQQSIIFGKKYDGIIDDHPGKGDHPPEAHQRYWFSMDSMSPENPQHGQGDHGNDNQGLVETPEMQDHHQNHKDKGHAKILVYFVNGLLAEPPLSMKYIADP